MDNAIVFLPGMVLNRLDGAFADVQGPNFKQWPEKPSGTAARSERDKGLQLAAANSRELPEIEIFEHINYGGAS